MNFESVFFNASLGTKYHLEFALPFQKSLARTLKLLNTFETILQNPVTGPN